MTIKQSMQKDPHLTMSVRTFAYKSSYTPAFISLHLLSASILLILPVYLYISNVTTKKMSCSPHA